MTHIHWVLGELEHLKIETRLINEKFVSVMGECGLDVMGTPSRLNRLVQVCLIVEVNISFVLFIMNQ